MNIQKKSDGFYILEVTRDELDEIDNGLGWSISEGGEIDAYRNSDMRKQIEEVLGKKR